MNIKHLLFFNHLFLILNTCCYSQKDYGFKIIETLTADSMHGRGYINNGDKKAAEYIARQFAEMKLKSFGKSYFQHLSYPVNTFPDSMHISAGGKKLIPGIDFIVDAASGSAKGIYRLVWVTPAKIDSCLKANNGKKDVIYAFDYRTEKNAEKVKYYQQLMIKLTKQAPVIKIEPKKLTWSVADYAMENPLIEVLAGHIDSTAHNIYIHISNKIITQHQTQNVIAYIQGSNNKLKKNYFVFTAHYDHLGKMGCDATFKGANDNASGVALLLNIARYYAQNPPTYSVAFMAFAGEEAGLKGSFHYIQQPLFPLKNIRFLINTDIAGFGEEGITVVNATKHPEEFSLLKQINDKQNLLTQIKARGEAANSDHYPFSQAGVKSFFIYTLGGSTAYHDIFDIKENLTLYAFENLTRLIVDFANDVLSVK
jgi:hypothetical protein